MVVVGVRVLISITLLKRSPEFPHPYVGLHFSSMVSSLTSVPTFRKLSARSFAMVFSEIEGPNLSGRLRR